MVFKGVLIEESLENREIIKTIYIRKTRVEPVTAQHNTPWLRQWTLHAIEVPEQKAEKTAEIIARSLESEHAWYADFRNNEAHYIIFRNKIFRVTSKEQYQEVIIYGLSLGIPKHQLVF